MSLMWVVSYDVHDDKRRKKVHDTLCGYGLRVQYSVFECHIDERQCIQLEGRLQKLIDLATDNVRFYPLDETLKERVRVLGTFGLTKNRIVEFISPEKPRDPPPSTDDHPF